jgi:hypothetical protein
MVPHIKRVIKAGKRKILLGRRITSSDYVVVSIKKSGRTWLRAMLTRLFHEKYGTPTNLLLDGTNHKAINPRSPSVLFVHDSNPVASATDVVSDLSIYRGKKVLLLVRHPADVVVSLYHHYKHRKTGKRQQLTENRTIYDFAAQPDHGIHTIISFMNKWAIFSQNNSDVLILRYEDLRADSAHHLLKVAEHIGIDVSSEQIGEAVAFGKLENLRALEVSGFFKSKSLRKVDTSNPDALKVRRGRVGGYRDYFSEAEQKTLDAIIQTELEPSLGYHDDDEVK